MQNKNNNSILKGVFQSVENNYLALVNGYAITATVGK